MNKTRLHSKTKVELMKLARRLGLRGISTMSKPQLLEKITNAKSPPAKAVTKHPVSASAASKRATAALKRRAVRKRAPAPPASKARPKTKRKVVKVAARPRPAAKRLASKPTVDTSAGAAIEMSAHKFDLAPKPPLPKQVFQEEHLGELPETYGTGRLFLTPRDPHWLFAYWDLSWQQMADHRSQSSDGRLLLRVFEKNHKNPIQELTLQHDSRSWYIPVNKGATTYSAELGYWRHDGSFHVISRSREANTPPDAVSPDTTAKFVTIPIDIPFHELLTLIRTYLHHGEQLAEALQRLQTEGFRFPFKVGVEVGPWSAEQAGALEKILGGDIMRRIPMGSFEITEWLRRRLQEETSSGMFSTFRPAGASKPAGAAGRKKQAAHSKAPTTA